MAGNRTSPRRTSSAPTQPPPGRGGRRGAAASNGAIAAAAAANAAAARAANAGGDGEILEVDLNPTDAADIRDTTNHEMDNETEKDHRRRNTEFIKWMKLQLLLQMPAKKGGIKGNLLTTMPMPYLIAWTCSGY